MGEMGDVGDLMCQQRDEIQCDGDERNVFGAERDR